jgi:hypothetical protein
MGYDHARAIGLLFFRGTPRLFVALKTKEHRLIWTVFSYLVSIRFLSGLSMGWSVYALLNRRRCFRCRFRSFLGRTLSRLLLGIPERLRRKGKGDWGFMAQAALGLRMFGVVALGAILVGEAIGFKEVQKLIKGAFDARAKEKAMSRPGVRQGITGRK